MGSTQCRGELENVENCQGPEVELEIEQLKRAFIVCFWNKYEFRVLALNSSKSMFIQNHINFH